MSVSLLGGQLIVEGNSYYGQNVLTVSQNGSTLTVSDNGVVNYFNTSGINQVVLKGRHGPDRLSVEGLTVNAALYGNAGNDVLRGGQGNDYLYGGQGDDTLVGGPLAKPVMMSFTRIYGPSLYSFGNTSSFAVYPSSTTVSYPDNDCLYGEDGNDTLIGGIGADLLSGGNHTDTVDYSDRTDPVMVSLDDFANDGWYDPYTGLSTENDNACIDVENLVGGWSNDILAGTNQNNRLLGGPGSDCLYGYAGDDQLDGGAGPDWLDAGDGADTLRGGDDNDSLFGAGGNDNLYPGAGDNSLSGGDGDDILVSIGGGTSDVLRGNAGFDSFWCDAEATETVADLDGAEAVAGHLHRVAAFNSTTVKNANGTQTVEWVSRDLLGQSLQDPAVFDVTKTNFDKTTSIVTPTYGSFSGRPLFTAGGPAMTDVVQGALGDCYFLAPLAATAKTKPDRIRQAIVDLGDGTFAVQFFRGGAANYYRVDADLPTVDGMACYAATPNGSLWAALLEKAYAFFRKSDGQYLSIKAGTAGETFASLGIPSGVGSRSPFQTAQDFLRGMQNDLNAGRAVTLSTPPGVVGSDLVSLHVYAVDHVNFDANGTATGVVLRNPWGRDGNGTPSDGADDGWVTVSAHDIYWTWVTMDSAAV